MQLEPVRGHDPRLFERKADIGRRGRERAARHVRKVDQPGLEEIDVSAEQNVAGSGNEKDQQQGAHDVSNDTASNDVLRLDQGVLSLAFSALDASPLPALVMDANESDY